jgi:hypothetical protein
MTHLLPGGSGPKRSGALLAWLMWCTVCAAAAPPPEASEAGTISFCAALSPDEESAPTYSPATGLGRFTLRRSDLELRWEVVFQNLTSPLLSANVHGPQRPGANAQVLFPLAPPGALASPIRGSLILNDGQLEYLLTGRMYLNFSTRNYPEGELRAQIQRIRPGEVCPDPTPPSPPPPPTAPS